MDRNKAATTASVIFAFIGFVGFCGLDVVSWGWFNRLTALSCSLLAKSSLAVIPELMLLTAIL